jgi:hypothetical protein
MRRFALLLGVALSFLCSSAVAQYCDGFTDVPSSSPFCPDVTWLKTYGITEGCSAGMFCPNEDVTRLQMAAFMHRLGENPAFVNGGNAFGVTAVLGTSDNNSLTINVDGQRAMMVQPVVDPFWGFNPNVVNGANINVVSPSVAGATIAGGGGCNDGTGGSCSLTGDGNQVTESFGTVGGGLANSAGNFGTVAGGEGNSAGSWGAVPGGYFSSASAEYSFAAGGVENNASGYASFAAGDGAQATDDNSFVWSGWSSGDGAPSNGPAQFYIGADHGFSVDYHTQQTDLKGTRFFYVGDLNAGDTIVVWNGAVLTDGGTWTNASDRALKEDFTAVDAQAVLAKVAQLPIDEWRYKTEAGQRHLGPVAQDFYAAFGLGADDRHITTVDEGGVALAAIKGLNAKVDEQQREIAKLTERVKRAETLAADVVALKAALAELQRGKETVAVK